MANHEHRFDPISGWCSGCNFRDDGRLTNRAGTVLQRGRDDVPYFQADQHLARLNELQKRIYG